MTIKIKLEDKSLLENFNSKASSQRVSGRGPLADSWIISRHLRHLSKKLGLEIGESNVTGVHIYILDNYAIVSGANFDSAETLENLVGRSFSTIANIGRMAFKFESVVEKVIMPANGSSPETIPLDFYLNSVVFKIKVLDEKLPDFYSEMTLNQDLLKELARPVEGGEVALDFQMMNFEKDMPLMASHFESTIAKVLYHVATK